MPKNFVGRLQDLENEMKTVLSICDQSNHGINSNKKMQKGIQYSALRSSSNLDCAAHGKVENEDYEGPNRVAGEDNEGLFHKKCSYGKPNSAPGLLPPAKKGVKLECLPKRKRFSGYVPSVSKKKEAVESVESSEWFDCPTHNHEAEGTLEQTLRPVDQILTDISQLGNQDCFSKRSTIWCDTCRRRIFDCICRVRRSSQTQHGRCENDFKKERGITAPDINLFHPPKKWKRQDTARVLSRGRDQVDSHLPNNDLVYTQSQKDVQDDDGDDDNDECKESFIHHIKPGLKENPFINALVRKIEKKEIESKSIMNMDIQRPLKSLRSDPTGLKQNKDVQSNEKDNSEKFNNEDNGHGERVRLPFDENKYPVRPATAPAKARQLEILKSSHKIRERNEPRKRNRSIRNNTNRDLEKTPRINGNLNLIPEEQQSETGNSAIIRQTTHSKSEGNVHHVSDEYSCSDEESSIDPKQDIVHLKQKKNLSDGTTRKIAEIIQKNHEKIEKMRKSKSLALNKVKVMKEKYDAMELVKNELTEKFEKLLGKNEELVRELKETDASKQQIIQEWENYKKENSSTTLLDKLQSVNEENLQCKEKIQTLEQQLQEKMQWTDENDNNNGLVQVSDINQDKYYEYHILFKRQEAAYRRLVQGMATLEEVIKNNKEKEKRLSEIKTELKRRTAKTQCYLERLTSEKTELLHMVNKLQTFAEEQKSKIHELHEEIKKKDEELEKQQRLLQEKSENLEDTNKELETIRKTSVDLEDQVKTLRKSIEDFDEMHQNLLKERQDFESTVQKIKGENNKLQEQLSGEKDSIQIKEKIIEDQQETIKQLKEKSDEVKKMVEKVQSLERLINLEREEKLELQETIERLRRKKDELKQKVKSLEAELLLAPQEVVRDLKKTQIVLHELENQVQIKQKEWEILLQSLIKEKEQACSVAAFATKKLIQTTSDFQRQSDSQKKLYRLLAENIVEKKKSFNESTEKTVRFSEELSQSNFNREQRAHQQRQRLHQKQAGILKKSREWFPRNESPLESFSSIDLNKFRGLELSEDFSENDEIYQGQT